VMWLTLSWRMTDITIIARVVVCTSLCI